MNLFTVKDNKPTAYKTKSQQPHYHHCESLLLDVQKWSHKFDSMCLTLINSVQSKLSLSKLSCSSVHVVHGNLIVVEIVQQSNNKQKESIYSKRKR